MPRAGFSLVGASRIRFGRDGQWYGDDEPITHMGIRRLFSRALRVLADGRGRLELGEERVDVTIEDTPWVVVRVDGDAARGFTVTLNDETTEPLEAATLRVGPGNVLYCKVKGRSHEARFLRPPYYDLMRHAEPGPGGRVVMRIRGVRVFLGAA